MLNSDNRLGTVKASTQEKVEESEQKLEEEIPNEPIEKVQENDVENQTPEQSEEKKTPEKSEEEIIPEEQTEPEVVPTEQELKAAKLDEEKFLPEIPSHAQYLIVGGGTAAMAAFKAIRANDPTARVIRYYFKIFKF